MQSVETEREPTHDFPCKAHNHALLVMPDDLLGFNEIIN